jgi:hypothetical protein
LCGRANLESAEKETRADNDGDGQTDELSH